MKNRLLIAEDHNLLRQGLRSLIDMLPDFEVIGECKDGKEAVRLALTLAPVVVLMDLSMPGLNGIEATAQIKRRLPDIKVVALTSYKTDEYVREALRAGADGYILKDASYDELVMALRSVVSGKKFLSPDVPGTWSTTTSMAIARKPRLRPGTSSRRASAASSNSLPRAAPTAPRPNSSTSVRRLWKNIGPTSCASWDCATSPNSRWWPSRVA